MLIIAREISRRGASCSCGAPLLARDANRWSLMKLNPTLPAQLCPTCAKSHGNLLPLVEAMNALPADTKFPQALAVGAKFIRPLCNPADANPNNDCGQPISERRIEILGRLPSESGMLVSRCPEHMHQLYPDVDDVLREYLGQEAYVAALPPTVRPPSPGELRERQLESLRSNLCRVIGGPANLFGGGGKIDVSDAATMLLDAMRAVVRDEFAQMQIPKISVNAE